MRNIMHIEFVLLMVGRYICSKYALYCTMDIGKTITARRSLLNITQEYLSDISGVGLRTIVQIENGKGNPSLVTLSKIADVLGMEVVLHIKKPSIK